MLKIEGRELVHECGERFALPEGVEAERRKVEVWEYTFLRACVDGRRSGLILYDDRPAQKVRDALKWMECHLAKPRPCVAEQVAQMAASGQAKAVPVANEVRG